MKPKAILGSILGVLAVAILIGLAWPAIMVNRTAGPEALMQVLYSQLSVACQQYKQEYGKYPESQENKHVIAALTGDNPRKIVFFEPHSKQLNDQKEILDRWGTPIRITFPADEPPSIVSAGKDRIFETTDDIKDKR